MVSVCAQRTVFETTFPYEKGYLILGVGVGLEDQVRRFVEGRPLAFVCDLERGY
jgi:hypothetical protein